MSEVKRLEIVWYGEVIHVVKDSDYDAAKSELAALREELELSERNRLAAERRYYEMATARDCIATNYNQLSYGATICKDKLGAAEQRNAECVALLRHSTSAEDQDHKTWWNARALILQAAPAKPAKAGASE